MIGRAVTLLAGLLLLAGCVSTRPPTVATPLAADEPAAPPRDDSPSMSGNGQAALAALALIGTPYRFGGNGSRGFDCSGLVRHAYAQAGLGLPRTTRQQREATRLVMASETPQTGDLVFFRRGRSALHVGLYLGENRFVHAAVRGGGVRIDNLANPHWRATYLETRRPDPGVPSAPVEDPRATRSTRVQLSPP